MYMQTELEGGNQFWNSPEYINKSVIEIEVVVATVYEVVVATVYVLLEILVVAGDRNTSIRH